VEGRRILVGAVQMLLHTGVALGIDRARLLASAELAESELRDRDAYVPLARQIALGRAIMRERPAVNIAASALARVSASDFGVLGYVITHAATLRGALDAFVRFQRLLTDGVRWSVSDGAPCTIAVDVDPDYEALGYPVEALVGLWVKLGRALTNEAWSPIAVRFAHECPAGSHELDAILGVRATYGAARSEMVVSAETLGLPLAAGNAALMPSVRQLAEARLAEIDGCAPFTSRVRAALSSRLAAGDAGKTALARSLGVSERTLSRRLREDGTTFRDLLDDVRRDLALAWLREGAYAVYEVAYLLGYSEPSTFHRCFRRWTGGRSPSAWRKSMA
jgi:AraC-like DNA-binding protein